MRYYVEINRDLENEFIISFNHMNDNGIQVVRYLIYTNEITTEHNRIMERWILNKVIIKPYIKCEKCKKTHDTISPCALCYAR